MEPTIKREDEWAQRIVSEFLQCPGLRLTASQAARLWGLTNWRAKVALTTLVEQHVLYQLPDGTFVRRGACPRCG